MMDGDLLRLLAGARKLTLEDGTQMRLLSAWETLEARREAVELARDGSERALCANACLLARALERGGTPVFASGQTVLEELSPGQIEQLARRWARFNRRENPSPEGEEGRVDALKKACSTRHTSG